MSRARAVLPVALLAISLLASACGSDPAASSTDRQFSPKRAAGTPSSGSLAANTHISGTISAPGGQFLTDDHGRIVTFHGVNAVYKRAPYHLTVEPGKVNSLSDADAARIQRLGFNVVRVGILWEGIEPGTGGPNQPNVCAPGRPADPHMWDEAKAQRYLDEVAKVVATLGRHHVYALLDMHQDVWNQLFSGEGMPEWATCTDGHPVVIYPGRWSENYGNPAVDASFSHLFNNDVVGNLQGEYQRTWTAVAHRFATNPWILGYDPMNEPADYSPVEIDGRYYSPGLSCLYAGSGGASQTISKHEPLPCPPQSPKTGVIQAIEAADKTHLVFPEADNASRGDHPYLLGVIALPRIVFNFHVYCAQRSGVTGNPTDLAACSDSELSSMVTRAMERAQTTSSSEPLGPAMFMTEFGATDSKDLASLLTADTTTLGLGWMWWSWRYYDDPTGSSAEALIDQQNVYSPAASTVSTTYPMAVAGTPISSVLNTDDGLYTLTYLPDPKASAPTVVFVSESLYPRGYCSVVVGGSITSKPGSPYLTVEAAQGAATTVLRISPHRCIGSSPLGVTG